jgi:hypothetical protein
MAPVVVILMFLVVAAVMLVVAAHGQRLERERTAMLAALSAERGWAFAPAKDRRTPRDYRRFELFTRGHSRSAFNTMRGSIDVWTMPVRFQMGDYTYSITTSNGKSSSTRTYEVSYVLLELPFAGVPDLTIRPEGVLDSMAQALGFQDIDFEDVEFSRRFVVQSADKRFAYDLCHPRMIEFLKARMERDDALVIRDGAMCFWGRERWDAPTFVGWVATLHEFFGLWPSHVVRDLGGAPATERA